MPKSQAFFREKLVAVRAFQSKPYYDRYLRGVSRQGNNTSRQCAHILSSTEMNVEKLNIIALFIDSFL